MKNSTETLVPAPIRCNKPQTIKNSAKSNIIEDKVPKTVIILFNEYEAVKSILKKHNALLQKLTTNIITSTSNIKLTDSFSNNSNICKFTKPSFDIAGQIKKLEQEKLALQLTVKNLHHVMYKQQEMLRKLQNNSILLPTNCDTNFTDIVDGNSMLESVQNSPIEKLTIMIDKDFYSFDSMMLNKRTENLSLEQFEDLKKQLMQWYSNKLFNNPQSIPFQKPLSIEYHNQTEDVQKTITKSSNSCSSLQFEIPTDEKVIQKDINESELNKKTVGIGDNSVSVKTLQSQTDYLMLSTAIETDNPVLKNASALTEKLNKIMHFSQPKRQADKSAEVKMTSPIINNKTTIKKSKRINLDEKKLPITKKVKKPQKETNTENTKTIKRKPSIVTSTKSIISERRMSILQSYLSMDSYLTEWMKTSEFLKPKSPIQKTKFHKKTEKHSSFVNNSSDSINGGPKPVRNFLSHDMSLLYNIHLKNDNKNGWITYSTENPQDPVIVIGDVASTTMPCPMHECETQNIFQNVGKQILLEK